MLTGTIIGMARALGETAPLLMIGMVAFIVDVPEFAHRSGHSAAGADLPLGRQSGARISSSVPRAPSSCCSAFLVVMNAAAVILRNQLREALVERGVAK